MSNDKPNYGNWSNPLGPMAPMMEQWSGAFKAWTDAWSAFLPGGRSAWPQDPWSAAAGQAYTARGPAAHAVSVEICSKRPTEVIANLKPGTELAGKLAADSFAPPLLNEVTLTRQPGHLKVSVTVADKQAAGRYNGVIRSADGCVVGDLTVIITEASAKPA